MRPSQVWVVFVKEAREVLRDRRTLVFMLLVPTLAIPLLMWVSTELLTYFTAKLARERAPVLLLNPEVAPELVSKLRDSTKLKKRARRLEGVLEELGLAARELSLVKSEPAAFMRLLASKGLDPEQVLERLRRASGIADLELEPRRLLQELTPPHLEWLERPPEGMAETALDDPARREQELLAAVRRKQLAAALEFPPRAGDLLASQESVPVTIYYLESSDRSQAALRSLRRVLKAVGNQLLARRIEERRLPAGFARPLEVRSRRLPGPGFMAKLLSMLLPYMILIFALLGAMYPAIDLGAGEKERGTLETLLVTPVDRLAVVLGKFGVVLLAAVVAALLATASLTVSMRAGVLGTLSLLGGDNFSFGPAEAVWALLVVLPTACTFAALLLVLAVFARSFKEAQSYASPLQILVILPAFASFAPGVELDYLTALLPVVNVSLALKAIFTGMLDQHYGHLAVLFASSLLLAGLLLVFTTWWFHREQVLFRA